MNLTSQIQDVETINSINSIKVIKDHSNFALYMSRSPTQNLHMGNKILGRIFISNRYVLFHSGVTHWLIL